jgi:toxin YoeB
MNVEFTSNAGEDFSYWIQYDKEIVAKIRELIKAIRQDPYHGIGKPEPLKFDLKGFWSRRSNGEHRLVYTMEGTKGKNYKCIVIQCRYHYDD